MTMTGEQGPELTGAYVAALDESLAVAFERAAAQHADAIAMRTATEALSYDAINRAANRLAHAILAQRGSSEEPIAFVAERTSVELICILAILKSGKAYVALDPAQPIARLAAVCASVEPGLILCSAQCRALAERLSGATDRCLEAVAPGTDLPDHNPALPIEPARIAAIYFTSGSTGEPKGVYYDQRGLLHRIFATILRSGIRAGDRQALHLRCDASWSLTILFSALLTGAAVHPIDIATTDASAMARWVATQGITHFPITSSLFRQWLDALPEPDERRYPALRLLNVGAEALPRRDVERFKQHFTLHCVLMHSLATSECGRITCASITRATPLPDERVAAGYPDFGMEILIVDDGGSVLARGETGEIAVRTRYAMRGYWREPKLTAAVLRPDPDGSDQRIYFTGDLGRIGRDGQLVVLGRRDAQAKVRGFRVQTDEIEMRLLRLALVREATVLVLSDPDGDARLVAYLVAQAPAQASVEKLRAALAVTLPDHMIPSSFVFLPALPLNAAGKVDRRALPRPSPGRPSLDTVYVAPRDALEARLVQLWEQVLPAAPIGIDDDFLGLGGDSLHAFSLLSRVNRDFDVTLSPQELFACASVRAMAELVGRRRGNAD
jgi:amino acid adenylation domain-containing protein